MVKYPNWPCKGNRLAIYKSGQRLNSGKLGAKSRQCGTFKIIVKKKILFHREN